jgi:hypothetical protein
MRRRAKPRYTPEVERLGRLISVHSVRILEASGQMQSCDCDLCRRAGRRLRELELDG